jgi:hypothetical protein
MIYKLFWIFRMFTTAGRLCQLTSRFALLIGQNVEMIGQNGLFYNFFLMCNIAHISFVLALYLCPKPYPGANEQ